jgi:hypothetical protein
MDDHTDYDTGYIFICLLQHPELKGSRYSFSVHGDLTVDEFAVCDEWKLKPDKTQEVGECPLPN